MRWASGGPIGVAGETLPRDDFLAAVRAVADRLPRDRPLAVVAEPTMTALIEIVAAIEAGIVCVPISPDSAPREREHILRDSGAALRSAPGLDRWVAQDVEPATTPDDTALVLYTSGTTGPPKGVPITRRAIASGIAGLVDAWAWSPDDVLVHGLPLYHVHGLVLGVLGPLSVGSSLHHTGRPTPEAYAAAVGTLYFGVPTVWARVAREPTAARALRAARLLVSGSAALPAPVFDALAALCGQAPIERYGMTETLITLSARSDEPRLRGSVGGPVGSTRVRIVHDTGADVAVGEPGELVVAGPTVFSGYLRSSDTHPNDGWFRTGDVATVDHDGHYHLIGRATTDLITSGGFRIGAGEVEDALLTHPAVLEAAVLGAPDDDLGQRIVAFVVAPGLDEAAVLAHVADVLAVHKRPRRVTFLHALPRNAMGKVDKTVLGA